MDQQPTILLVDDEPNIRRSVVECLEPQGYTVIACATAYQFLEYVRSQYIDMAIVDVRIGDHSGIDLYQTMLSEKIECPTIFISGNASLNEAAESVKVGAFDFLEKPFSSHKLQITISNCLKFSQMKAQLDKLKNDVSDRIILGEHAEIKNLRKSIQRVAATDAVVMISGESGTGKELVAASIHAYSKRKDQIFLTVNCSAIPENLVESTLFGHVKGAFTGAVNVKKGYFEAANGGTLFLDEIGDMPLSVQARLLRVLESKEIQKVGSDRMIPVDVRVISASHKNLHKLVDEGLFRQDLFFRLSIIPIESPALRDHASDISLLANYFVSEICTRNGFANKKIDPKCFDRLSAYSWPGNVRELRNIIERMVILSGDRITLGDIPVEICGSPTSNQLSDGGQLTLKAYREGLEAEYIRQNLKRYAGNISKVALALDIDRTHLYKKMKAYGIERKQTFD